MRCLIRSIFVFFLLLLLITHTCKGPKELFIKLLIMVINKQTKKVITEWQGEKGGQEPHPSHYFLLFRALCLFYSHL